NKADDEATDDDTEAAAEPAPVDHNEPYILAVTACTTGIAHTYMARDALAKLSSVLMDENVRQALLEADSTEAVLAI
ncbi:hypothetical protein DD924_14890, partial [Staphylococcus pseudintermedius]